MKIDVPACLLFGFTGVAVLVTRPTSSTVAAAAAASAPPATAQVRTIELTDPQPPRQWFPTLAELLADPAINPAGVELAEDATRHVQTAFERASAELNDIEAQFTESQRILARQHVERGTAQPYVSGSVDIATRGDAGVVVAQLDDGAGPWLVRISHDELPQAAVWKQQARDVRDQAYDFLSRRIREATAGAATR